jgi:hypothetical protein
MARTTTTSGGAMTAMWRSVDDEGETLEVESDGLYKLVEPNPNDYLTPPKGTRAKLRLSGISETFPMPTYNDPEKMEDKVRVEFLILNISGKNIEWMKGKRFTQMYTDRVSAKSSLGQLFQTLSGQPIPASTEGYPYDGYIGTEFVALIGSNDAGTYPRVNHEAIETGKTMLAPAVAAYFAGGNGTAPEPALVGATVEADESDPFTDDEEL